MLRGLRKASSNWLGKAVMAAVVGFLVISFAIWGIGENFRGFGRSTVAKIGHTEITVEQFRTLYNDRLQQYSRQAGRPIGPEQARQLGLDRVILGQIVSEMLLDERARALGLSLSTPRLPSRSRRSCLPGAEWAVRTCPVRAGHPQCRLHRSPLRRRATPPPPAPGTRGHDRVGIGGTESPGQAASRYENEQRSMESVCSTAPRPARIRRLRRRCWQNTSRSAKNASEHRSIASSGRSLIPTEQARWIEISRCGRQARLRRTTCTLVTPERRHVLQIDFPNPEAASIAAERIAKGTSFADIAKELGKSKDNTYWSDVNKNMSLAQSLHLINASDIKEKLASPTGCANRLAKVRRLARSESPRAIPGGLCASSLAWTN